MNVVPSIAAYAAAVAVGMETWAIAQSSDPCEAQRLLAPTLFNPHKFGGACATNGEHWVIGDTQAKTLCSGPPISCSTGAIHVYASDDDRLVHVQTIVPADARLYDFFGSAISLDGNRMAVSSLFKTRPGSTEDRPGAILMYEHDGEEWVEVDRVWPPDTVRGEFGETILLTGDTLLVYKGGGAKFWVYRREGGQWRMVQEEAPPEPVTDSSWFGSRFAAWGDWFAVGASGDRTGHVAGGSVFIYRRQPDGTLAFVQRLLGEDRLWLGSSLAFSDGTLLVGAPLAGPIRHQGAVHLYEFDGERWVFDGRIAPLTTSENESFGTRMESSGRTLAVRASQRTRASDSVVFAFERSPDGHWRQTRRLVPTTPSYATLFANGLALGAGHVLAGATFEEVGGQPSGAAYFFDLGCVPCRPDLDSDTRLTVFDFLTFLNLFQDANPLADFLSLIHI